MAALDVAQLTPIRTTTTGTHQNGRQGFSPSLMCDENVDESGVDTLTAVTDGETNSGPSAFGNGDSRQQHAGDEAESARTLVAIHGNKRIVDRRLWSGSQTHQNEDTNRNGKTVLDKYLIEPYADTIPPHGKEIIAPVDAADNRMKLEDLTADELQLLQYFPLASGCTFSKTAVDRLSNCLSATSINGSMKLKDFTLISDTVASTNDPHTNVPLLIEDDDADKTLSADEADEGCSKLIDHKQVSQKRSASLRQRNIRPKNLRARGSEPRIQDVVLHLLPASQQSVPVADELSSQTNFILEYLSAKSVQESERQRLVNYILLATKDSNSNHVRNINKNGILNGERHDSVAHKLAVDAALMGNALFDNLIALAQPPHNPVQGEPAANEESSTALKHVDSNDTLKLPPLPRTEAYAAFAKALYNDDDSSVLKFSRSSRDSVRQRVASLVRKCLTVEIPLRQTRIFQQVDLNSVLMHAATNKAADRLVLNANAALSVVGLGNATTEGLPQIAENKTRPELHASNSAPTEQQLNAYNFSKTAPKNNLNDETNKTLLGDFSKKRKIGYAEDSDIDEMVTAESSAKELPLAATPRGKRKSRHGTYKPDRNISLLKRFVTLGFESRNGTKKCRRQHLSLLKAYQPPLNSFYDLIDSTEAVGDDDAADATLVSHAEKAARNVSNQMTAANILGTLGSMQLIRSWFMAQLLAVRAETHPHIRLAKRQALLRKYYNHLVSAYKLKKSAVRVREQTNIDFDTSKKESNRMLDRCKQALILMFEDKRKLIELEKTLDIATNRYDTSRSVVSTRAARKTRGGPAQPTAAAATASANADAELLLSLGAVGAAAPSSSGLLSSTINSSSMHFGSHQHHHTLYPDHHDILGGGGTAAASSSSYLAASPIHQQQHFLTAASGRAGLLHAPTERSTSQPRGSLLHDHCHHQSFHRPQLLSHASSSYSYMSGGQSNNAFAGGSTSTRDVAGTAAGGVNPAASAGGMASTGGTGSSDRPWLPTANTLLNFRKRRAATLSQMLKTEIDEADMLSDLAYLNGSSQTMHASSSASSKRKRQTAIKSNVRVDSNRLMIDEHAFHRNQAVMVEPNPSSSAAAAALSAAITTTFGYGSGEHGAGGAGGGVNAGQFGATILSFSAGEVWLRRSFDGNKFRVSIGQLMDGTYKLIDAPTYRRK